MADLIEALVGDAAFDGIHLGGVAGFAPIVAIVG